MTRPIRSPEALPLELHLMNDHRLSASTTMELEDLGLEMRHALLHADMEAAADPSPGTSGPA